MDTYVQHTQNQVTQNAPQIHDDPLRHYSSALDDFEQFLSSEQPKSSHRNPHVVPQQAIIATAKKVELQNHHLDLGSEEFDITAYQPTNTQPISLLAPSESSKKMQPVNAKQSPLVDDLDDLFGL